MVLMLGSEEDEAGFRRRFEADGDKVCRALDDSTAAVWVCSSATFTSGNEETDEVDGWVAVSASESAMFRLSDF